MNRFILILAAALLAATPAFAEETKSDGPKLEIDGAGDPAASTTPHPGSSANTEDDAAKSFDKRTSIFQTISQRAASIINRTTLGGYGEDHFIWGGAGERSTFVAQRYVLFVYSQITERISTATEVEFEFAGSPLKRDGVLGTGEVLLEFSVIDFKFTDWLKLRTGVLLIPFGAFNLRHDAPSQELSERPIAYTSVVPSTWYETGAGFLGSFDLGGDHQLSYEIYAINGLDASIADGVGFLGARGSNLKDNNGDKAFVGRVSYSPFLGLEVGLSGYTGKYNQTSARVNMANLDLTLRAGPFELLAEGVMAKIDPGFVEGFNPETSSANTRTPVPEGMRGFYVQGAYHFTIPPLWRVLPEDLKHSQLTAVLRYEGKDTNTAVTTPLGDQRRITLGLNYRPTRAYVFKTDLQLNSNGVEYTDGKFTSFSPRFLSSVAFLF